MEVHNGSEDVVTAIKAAFEELADRKIDTEVVDRITRLEGGVINCESQPSDTCRLFNNVMEIMNKTGFVLNATAETELKSNVLMFRQSTVSHTSSLTLSLERGNVLVLYNGEEEDVEVVRQTLANRWPYPVVQDAQVQDGVWLWKVRRYPWRISYGSKFVDRAVGRATKLVRQISQDRLPQLGIPPPNNSDMESAKSLIVFLIKELSEKGWKFVGTNQVAAKSLNSCFLHFIK